MQVIDIHTRIPCSHFQMVNNLFSLVENLKIISNFLSTVHRRPSSSRPNSRAASPALSSKSRKSTISARGGHRHSYVEQQQLTDDESSESAGSYLDDYRSYRRDSGIRSTRQNVKVLPQASLDDDSDRFSRRSSHREHRERRGASAARSISSRTGDHRSKPHRLRSDSTQDSDTELGTRALVQAKIREKVAAQQSSLDESSSDFWKPKSTAGKDAKRTTKENGVKEKVTTAAKAKNREPEPEITSGVVNKNDAVEDALVPVPEGPPPKTPSFEWECEFCTFTNEPDTKICAICCKTPTTVPIQKKTSNDVANVPQETVAPAASATTAKTEPIKGRTKKISRKITFWPGTKSK